MFVGKEPQKEITIFHDKDEGSWGGDRIQRPIQGCETVSKMGKNERSFMRRNSRGLFPQILLSWQLSFGLHHSPAAAPPDGDDIIGM